MKIISLIIKTLLIYLLFILPKTILGQDTLSGIVLDTADSPIGNVLITAQTQKSHQHTPKQTRTNQKGEFNLPITTSTTSVVFQKQGYVTVGFNRDQLNKLLIAAHPSVTLPIAPQRQLADVIIKSRPPLIQHQLDKVILKVAGSSIEDIGSSMDLLKYGPGIVLIDGHILLNGNQSPEILINGKKLQLTGAARISFLNSLKSSDIEAIEIMAYPPVSFDAAGSGGLINIRLKKKLQQGLTGSLSFRGYQGLGGYPDYTPSVSLSYNKKKFILQMGVTHEYFKAYFDIGTKRSVVDHSGKGQYSSLAKNIRKVLLENQNLSLFYNLNKHDFLGIDLMHTITGGSTITSANSTLKYPESLHNQNALGHYL